MLSVDSDHALPVRKRFLAGPTRRLAIVLALFLVTGAIASACREQSPTAAYKHVVAAPKAVCNFLTGGCQGCGSACIASFLGITWGCADSQPVRTAIIHCTVHLPDTLALRIVRRSAVPTDTLMRWSIDDSVTILGPPGSTYDWYGMALVPTVVTIQILVAADSLPIPPLSLTMGFTPKPRPNWGTLDMAASADVEVVGYDIGRLMKSSSTANGVTLSVGGYAGNNTYADTDSTVYARSDTSGPNRSLTYMAKPGRLPAWNVYINPFLYASPNPPVGTRDIGYYNEWFAAQTGAAIPGDSLHHVCSHADLTGAIPTLERHEGLTRMVNSHYGVADSLVMNPPSPQIDTILERLVRDNSTYAPTLRLAINDTLRHFLANDTGTAFFVHQKAYDVADSANYNAALNHCLAGVPR